MGDSARAIALLEDAQQRRPANRDVLAALVTYLQEGGKARTALRYAEQLATLLPHDPQVQKLVEALRRQTGSP
jgi:Tfp pilus assembly protein PilF